jgi:colicin import membrane protein
MGNLFVLLFLFSGLALLAGMIKPGLVLRWLPEGGRNRKQAAKYFGSAVVLFFILAGVTLDPPEESALDEENLSQEVEAGEKVDEDSEEETIREEAERKAEEEAAREEAEREAREEAEREAEEEGCTRGSRT